MATGLALSLAIAGTHAQGTHSLSVGASYSYVRSNILPGCSCFSLNGGSAELELGLTHHLALMADATAVHQGGITPDDYSLTQLSYIAGIRYRITAPARRLHPFLEAGVGGANTFGSLSPSQTGVSNKSQAFAFQTGGGLEVRLGPRISLVPVRVDYLLTTFDNTAADRQDQLMVSAGVKFRLHR
jgi:peptidoglycan-associated lipoprotein